MILNNNQVHECNGKGQGPINQKRIKEKNHPHLGVPNKSIETKKKKKKEYVCGPWGVSTFIL
jgi:hypothetical protein